MNNINKALPLWLFIGRLPGVGAVTFHRILQQYPELDALWQQSNAQLKAVGLKPASAHLMRQTDPSLLRARLDELQDPGLNHASHVDTDPFSKLINGVDLDLRWLRQSNHHHVVTYFDPSYPALLKEIPNPPPLLFVQGNVDLLSFPQLAIVGSRHATRPGLQNTRMFSADLVKRGYTITSGLALGVDAQAHHSCLAEGGLTIAVVGSGLDIYYPKQNQALAREVAQQGAIVSEFPVGTQPNARNFPRRNRIISGLSLGTLVVEATERSGSLITARLAADQGREVFAIPGSIHNAQSRGCHLLIKQGATLVQSSDDIIEHLSGMTLYMKDAHFKRKRVGIESPVNKIDRSSVEFVNTISSPETGVNVPPESREPANSLTCEQAKVLDLLGDCPVPIDQLVEQTSWSVQELSSVLMNLQLDGLVNSGPGGYVLSNMTVEA
ncbi:MAG: DNA-protecting protein DprA [Gammaproteobacteria bacterium]|nr:MAG: DNA-protecting protein DprA [Gammaproteobacteria bacterium]